MILVVWFIYKYNSDIFIVKVCILYDVDELFVLDFAEGLYKVGKIDIGIRLDILFYLNQDLYGQ